MRRDKRVPLRLREAEAGAAAVRAAPSPARRIGPWPYLWLLVMGVFWGSTFSLAKIATEGGAHPVGLSFWQGALGCGFILILCLARRRPPPLTRRHLGFYAVCGLLGTAIPGTLFFYAAPHVPAGVLSISIAVVPIATYGMSVLLRADRITPARALGILLGLASIVLLVAPETALPSRDMTLWVLMAVLASAFYAGENLFVALARPAGSDTLAIACGMMGLGGLLMLPVVIAAGGYVSLAPPWGSVEWAVVIMAGVSALAYSLFIHVVMTAGPVFASQTAYTVTIAGVLWGMAIFGESHSAWIWASLAVMLAGLALVTPRPHLS